MATMCKVDGCINNVSSHGYCAKHYHRLKKYGNAVIKCKVEGCEKDSDTLQGLCRDHFQSHRRKCTIPGCDRAHLAKGYCSKHYEMNKQHGTPVVECLFEGCTKERTHRRYCAEHAYMEKKRCKALCQRLATKDGYCDEHYEVFGKIRKGE